MTKRYRHKKRGTVYEYVNRARMNSSQCPALDDRCCIIYKSITTGELEVRMESEFFDGRFEEIDDTL